MKSINSFGLTKGQKKEMKKWAKKLYDELEEKHVGYIVAEYSTIQQFLNDFFVLKENPWGGSLDL